MSFYLVLYLAILEVISGTTNITNNSNEISCYSCRDVVNINQHHKYGGKPLYFENKNLCIDQSNADTVKINTEKQSCVLNIVLSEDIKLPRKIAAKNYRVFFHFTHMANQDCQSHKRAIANVVCLNSSCRLLAVCCKENLCNTLENFNTTLLAIYSDSKNQNLPNSYSFFSEKKCKIDLKNRDTKKNQACVFAHDTIDSITTRNPVTVFKITENSKNYNFTTDFNSIVTNKIDYPTFAVTSNNFTTTAKVATNTTNNNSNSATELNYSSQLLSFVILFYQIIQSFNINLSG